MSSEVSVRIPKLSKAKAEAAVQTRVQTGGRLFYVDNLRVFLTILVILHHTAITYGADGSWFYPERPTTELAGILLTLFTGLNQFYFMGLFFLIAGYFVPGAVDRKGNGKFLKDRVIRLGIPLILFALLASPFLVYVNGVYDGWYTGSLQDFLAGYWGRLSFDSGPLWFVESLLVFSAVYILGRAVLSWLKREPEKQAALPDQKPLTHGRILAAALGLALITIAVRIFSPIGETWHNWQLAFYPQYVLLFAAGILAYRNGWLDNLSAGMRKTWSRVAWVCMAALPILMASTLLLSPGDPESALNQVKGGLNALAIITATWEAFYCLSMPILLLSIFHRRFDFQNRLSGFLSKNAYTAYIVHAPVIVVTALMFRSLALDPLLKFVLVAPLGVALTFLASHYLVRRLPFADRVL